MGEGMYCNDGRTYAVGINVSQWCAWQKNKHQQQQQKVPTKATILLQEHV